MFGVGRARGITHNIFILDLDHFCPKSKNNTHCVYAIVFKRTTMLEYIYDGHSIAYDPIYRVRKRDKG